MRTLHITAAVMMMVTSLAATVLGAPQFWDIPVPNKPTGLYDLPSQDIINIPKPSKPSGLYELPSSSNENRVVVGSFTPLPNNRVPLPSNQVTTALPLRSNEPLMPYEMSYNIMDGINSVYHTRQEVQTDTGLTGSYSYLRPDGIYQTVEYYVDNMGYHANVIESKEAPSNLQKVQSNRAKYEVKLPYNSNYLIDVDDAELEQYIQNALDFEPAVIRQESQVAQVSQLAQASNPQQLTVPQPTSQEVQTPVLIAQSQLTFPQVQPPQLNQGLPNQGLQPPIRGTGGYKYPAPERPFNPFSG